MSNPIIKLHNIVDRIVWIGTLEFCDVFRYNETYYIYIGGSDHSSINLSNGRYGWFSPCEVEKLNYKVTITVEPNTED